MIDMKLQLKIYELKGYIESMSEMADHDDQYHHPLIERIEIKMKEIIEEIEKATA